MTKPFQFTRVGKSRQICQWRQDFRDGKLSQEEKDILESKGIQWEVPDTAGKNKKRLLKMARDGKPKPHSGTHLGRALYSYTSKSSNCYDPEFDKKIRKLRPDWFVGWKDISNQKKEQLLEMARNGEPRPSSRTSIGNALAHYINKSSGSYDPEFDKKIRKLRPDWFVGQTEKAQKIKEELLRIARNGEARPNKRNSRIGMLLSGYTSKSSTSYDPEFDKKIRELRPDWFVDRNKAEENKKEILRVARNGGERPISKLGSDFSKYTNKSSKSYDPEFDKKIRKLRPDWFVTRFEKAEVKKEELLCIARNGKARPFWKSCLGMALRSYTCKSSGSYDPEFDKKIRKLRPDWFVSNIEKAEVKKEELLRIARNGEARPNNRTSIGSVLSSYTNKSSESYDPEFDKKIRELRPDWFVDRNKAEENKKEILRVARNGGERPRQTTSLGKALSRYTVKSSTSYDPEFDKKIRELRPDWFPAMRMAA